MTVEIKIGKYVSKKDGLHSLNLYVNLDGEPSPFLKATGVRVKAEVWDQGKQRVKGRGDHVKKQNLILAQKVALANDIITDYTLMKKPLVKVVFLKEFDQPGHRGNFLFYWEHKMKQNFDRGLIGEGTFEAEQRTLRKLQDFSPTLLYSELTRAKLEEFDAWHADRLERAGYDGFREREKALKYIKKYLRSALQEIDTRDQLPWPFDGFVWPNYKSIPVFLTEEEVRKIINLYDNPDKLLERMIDLAREKGMFLWNIEQFANEERVEKVRRIMKWFLFQCFTGVRYSDLSRLTFRHIEDEHLVFVPWKTRKASGAEVRMLLTEIIKKFMGKGHGRKRIHEMISYQKYNKSLKEMADICEIDKHVSTHVGRHTFATMSLNRGIPLERLKDLMGLTSIKALLVYVHITQKKLDEAMEKAYSSF